MSLYISTCMYTERQRMRVRGKAIGSGQWRMQWRTKSETQCRYANTDSEREMARSRAIENVFICDGGGGERPKCRRWLRQNSVARAPAPEEKQPERSKSDSNGGTTLGDRELAA